MYTDKNRETLAGKEAVEAAEDLQDSTLNWLLDMDLSEPQERLFTVDQASQIDTGLTDYELEVARRPMTRGLAGADDLETYIDEEIVISSETQSSDIYSSSTPVSPVKSTGESNTFVEPMAIDYSRTSGTQSSGIAEVVTDGIDILGLTDDDDMGEKYLVIKRAKPAVPALDTGEQEPVVFASETATVSAESDAGDELENSPESAAPPVDVTRGVTSLPPPLVLSEAPVLRLVSPGDSLNVANDAAADEAEAPLEGGDTAAAAASLPTDNNDVFGYIEAVSPLADDQSLDNYLLNGEQLQSGEPSLHELELVPIEGEGRYDASSSEDIDNHEDSHQLAGPCEQAVASVRPLIPQLMKELSIVLNERLASLGMVSDSVQAELMLGGDPTAVDQLLSGGFEPAIAICTSPLASLQQLRQVDVDVIYIRLVHGDTGQLCNQLFDEDFVLHAVEANPDESLVGVESDDGIISGAPASFAGFADDLLAMDTLDELNAGQWQPDDADIDDIFADLGQFTDEAGADEVMAGQPPGDQAGKEQADNFGIFAENICADEIAAEFEEPDVAPQADIDALFDSLGLVPGDVNDSCDMGVQELPVAGGQLQPAAGPEGGVASLEPEVDAANDFCCIPAGIIFSLASPGGGEIFSDFLDVFIEEGSSELEKLEDAVAAWEKEVGSEAAYAAVSRILHTIKGIAKGVGLQFYGTLVHNFETLLGALPRPQAGAEGDYFRIVNAWLDACVRGLDHIQDARADITNELPQIPGQSPVEERLAGLPGGGASVELSLEDRVSNLQPVSEVADARAKQLSKKIADDGARALAAQQSVRITSEKLDQLLNLSNQAQQLSVRTAQSVTRGKRASTEMQSRLTSVRAHIAGIADRALRSVAAQGVQPGAPMDALEMDQYSELQEAANILREGVEDLADLVDFATRQNTQVEALLKQQTKVISSIGSSIRGARVVPVSRLLPGLRRLVRTISVDLDKTVSFKVLNELGTLDRDDYARCQTILDHMVRNALDHGIEHTDERLAAGKSVAGLVTIDIRKAGADAVITLTDDGRGIDPQKMRESAHRKGLSVDVDALTDAEALRLIFHKGFSTSSSISQISGRGVGMDIVLTELQEMGGDIQIDSVPGQGTSFHIRVPSSVTVNGALLVSAGEQSYAIPLGGLIAVEQVPVEEFFAAVQNNTRLSLSGMECEPTYLATLCNNGASLEAKTWRTSVPVIIAGSPERYMAIAIDDVEEALELVIRSLGAQFSSVPGVAGAATTAAGEAIVALDLNLLVASVGAGDQSALHVDAGRDEGLLVMVVDDSRTQRMVATSQLETAGVETITAENGAVAIDLLNQADRLPDIILMDVEMPVKDGIQALREIRKSVRYGQVPIIMITSRTGLKHRAMAQAAGCNGYMGKPFNFRMLIGQINELTGHRLQLA